MEVKSWLNLIFLFPINLSRLISIPSLSISRSQILIIQSLTPLKSLLLKPITLIFVKIIQ